jgi:hypothetical protein
MVSRRCDEELMDRTSLKDGADHRDASGSECSMARKLFLEGMDH